MAAFDCKQEFGRLAPAGFYAALRVGFVVPMAECNTMPQAWIDRYTRMGYLVHDPVVRWVYGNTGAIRWHEIVLPDPQGVMREAAQYGMRFGAAVSCAPPDEGGHRSYATFARSDRDFTDAEVEQLRDRFTALHLAATPPANLTKAELEALSMLRGGLLEIEKQGR